jgi:hypothetical protein
VLLPRTRCGCGGEGQAAASGDMAADDEAWCHWVHHQVKMFLKIYSNNWEFYFCFEEPPGEKPPAKSDL